MANYTGGAGDQSGGGAKSGNAGTVIPNVQVAGFSAATAIVPPGGPTTQGLILLTGNGQTTVQITLVGD